MNQYAIETKQCYDEGTFCILDPDHKLWKTFVPITTERPSSHCPGISNYRHRGIDFAQPIYIGTTPKKTLLVISYSLGSQQMLLLKPENAPVVSVQHGYEYLNPPKGGQLKDRKERIIEDLPQQIALKKSAYSTEKYKKYGISYLCSVIKNNTTQHRLLDEYLKSNKLDHATIRLGREIIVSPDALMKVLDVKKFT